MERYREEFPTATVLPKMHILEDHVVPWMRRLHMGARLMGEQGAETQFQGIVNQLERLHYIVQEHNVESTPGLNSLRPAPRKRKRPSEEANYTDSTLSVPYSLLQVKYHTRNKTTK